MKKTIMILLALIALTGQAKEKALKADPRDLEGLARLLEQMK